MTPRIALLPALLAGLSLPLSAATKPLEVLLVLGGCCHDYATQKDQIKKGVEARLNARVTVEFVDVNDKAFTDKKTRPVFEVYKKADWGRAYDVVIHDECAADITDQAYVNNILDAHRNGLPAVNLHCAMHSYRWGNFGSPVTRGDDNAHWYEFIGLQSTGHGPQAPIDVQYTDAASPITKGLQGWTTINEELYNNVQILDAKELAKGNQKVPEKKDKKGKVTPAKETSAIVAWTNLYGPKKTRVFSTTLGHNNGTVGDERYLDLICRGLLWSVGKLGDDGKPAEGYGK
ncbi:MAG: ThuA domain-containing protein [Verrucomicrobiota bacterium]